MKWVFATDIQFMDMGIVDICWHSITMKWVFATDIQFMDMGIVNICWYSVVFSSFREGIYVRLAYVKEIQIVLQMTWYLSHVYH